MNGRDRRYALAALPATLYLLVLFVIPIGMVLAMSLTGAKPPGANYLRIFTAPVYLVVLANTLSVGLGVTLITLILAYPLAYLLSTLPARTATVLLGIVILPWFTSLLVRSYAWMILLGQSGIVNSALKGLGWIDRPLPLLYSAFGVYVATVHILLPYMVLTLYGTMRSIDLRLIRAAQAAGASPPRAFLHVYLPLSLPGVAGGCLLVFIMAIGFYVTPALLGGPRQMMIAQMIASEMLETLQWGFGGALAVVLLTVTFAALGVFVRLFGVARLMGGAR
jgi:ABC-type spermidine/putrescine transport system permease subunit I